MEIFGRLVIERFGFDAPQTQSRVQTRLISIVSKPIEVVVVVVVIVVVVFVKI